jgi:hypothetical protein
LNTDFLRIIAAINQDRRDLFLATANRIGTPVQNVEKDFWVVWVLDLLFNGRAKDEPRLLFKGGTSLSKAYGLIARFSEDIDITVFREDLGQPIEVNDLEALSGKKQRARLDEIKSACQSYIQGPLLVRLNQQMMEIFSATGQTITEAPVIVDPDDQDQQTLLVRYPSVNNNPDGYLRPSVKIEAGAKSALDPNKEVSIRPYLSEDFSVANLTINGVVTIDAERTFWDKVVILHGLRRWHDNRGVLRQQGHRISRHYYDIYKLYMSPIGKSALADRALGNDCVRHALTFFNGNDLDLVDALSGRFSITPTEQMVHVLNRDYEAMKTMIFGEIPPLQEVLDSISRLEKEINDISGVNK